MMTSGIFSLLFLAVFIFVLNSLYKKNKRKREERRARLRKALKRVERLEKIQRSFSVDLSAEATRLLESAKLHYLCSVSGLGKNIPNLIAQQKKRLETLPAPEKEKTERTIIPNAEPARTVALQSFFILHQALKQEAQNNTLPVYQVLPVMRDIEATMLHGRIEESLEKGEASLLQNALGTARSRFEHVVKIINENPNHQNEFNDLFLQAKRRLNDISNMMNNGEKAPLSTSTTQKNKRSDEDGLLRMFDSEKEKWS